MTMITQWEEIQMKKIKRVRRIKIKHPVCTWVCIMSKSSQLIRSIIIVIIIMVRL